MGRQTLVLIGSLDVVAPMITGFFLLAYTMTNLACLLVTLSRTPNFRPRFRFFSWHTAALGVVINITLLFYLNVWQGFFTLGFFIIIVLYLVYNAPRYATVTGMFVKGGLGRGE